MFTIQRSPQLFEAFIGTGFGINFQDNEKLSIQYLKKRAIENNDKKITAIIESIPFPISETNFDQYIDLKSKLMNKYGGYFCKNPLSIFFRIILKILFRSPYKIKDYKKLMNGLKYGKELAKKILISMDIKTKISKIDIPIYFFIGRHDYHTHYKLANEYFETIIATKKKWVWFEESAHSPLFEENEKFCYELIKIIDEN